MTRQQFKGVIFLAIIAWFVASLLFAVASDPVKVWLRDVSGFLLTLPAALIAFAFHRVTERQRQVATLVETHNSIEHSVLQFVLTRRVQPSPNEIPAGMNLLTARIGAFGIECASLDPDHWPERAVHGLSQEIHDLGTATFAAQMAASEGDQEAGARLLAIAEPAGRRIIDFNGDIRAWLIKVRTE